jgi:hypothetical protein
MRHPVDSWSSRTIGAFKSWRTGNPFGHRGFDYYVGRGTPVHASGPGLVVGIGSNMDRQIGFGHNITIRHDNGWTTLCAHLDRAPSVSVGARVAEGQQIGVAGDTGNAWAVGVHVHHQLWVGTATVDANLRDPLAHYSATTASGGDTHPIDTDGNDMADITEAQMNRIAQKSAETVWNILLVNAASGTPTKAGDLLRYNEVSDAARRDELLRELPDRILDTPIVRAGEVDETGAPKLTPWRDWVGYTQKFVDFLKGDGDRPDLDGAELGAAVAARLAPIVAASVGELSDDEVARLATAFADEQARRPRA